MPAVPKDSSHSHFRQIWTRGPAVRPAESSPTGLMIGDSQAEPFSGSMTFKALIILFEVHEDDGGSYFMLVSWSKKGIG